MSGRVGVGFDAHPFSPGRPLFLGGIEVPHDAGLAGHSDGDALLHAIGDAILGAAGLASIGERFPDDDPALAGAASGHLLEGIRDAARERGFSIESLDAVVIAESPRIAPHREAIRASIAGLLRIPVDRVNVRGTSTNGLGFPGRKEGIAVMAVVLLGSAAAEGEHRP